MLPIANFSSAPGNDYLAEGLIEELTSRLARVEGVRLVALSSPEHIPGANLDGVLQGSLRQADGRMRLILRLVDPADGSHLWVQRYERAVENRFQLEDELSESILAELRAVLLR